MKRINKIATMMIMVLLVAMVAGCGKVSSTSNQVKTTADTEQGILENGGVVRAKGDGVTVQITYGLNGMMTGGTWVPLKLNISNEGNDFDGTAVIILPNSSIGKGVAYKKDFSIAKGATKEVSMQVPNIGSFSKFQVQILEGEDVKVSKVVQTGFGVEENQDQLLAGILTENSTSLDYFDGVILEEQYGTSTKTVELNEQNFPEDSSELTSMAFLVINQFTTEKLSNEQINAMIDWIEQGGVLILGTGGEPTKVLSGFPEGYITGTIGERKQKELSFVGDTEDEKIVVDGIELTVDHAEKLTNIIEGGTIWKIAKGNGNIVLTDFDLGNDQINTWGSQQEFVEMLLKETMSNVVETHLNNMQVDLRYGDYIQQALNFYRDVEFPHTTYYIFLFTAYILIIGPIGYFILKKKDRRELIWALIPVTALVFHGAIFFTSTGSRLKSPVATTITMIDSSSEIWKEKVYATFMNPNKKSYQVELNSQLNHVMPLAQQDYSMIENEENFDNFRYSIEEQEDKTELVIEKGKAFSSETLTMDQVEKKQHTGFDKNLKFYINGASGTVTNQTGYDLLQAGIIYNGMYIYLGDMKAGETVTIDPNHIKMIQIRDSYFIAEQITQTMPTDTKEERARKHQLFNICNFFSNKLQNMKSGDGYLFGMVDQYEQDYITNSEITEMGKAFFYEAFRQLPEDAGDYYVQNIFENLTDSSEHNLNEYDNTLYGGQDEGQYTFDDSYEINQVASSALTSSGVFKENGLHIYAWNYKTKKYEEIFDKSLKLTEEQIKCYIYKNKMKLKFEAREEWTELPIISVSGMEVAEDARN